MLDLLAAGERRALKTVCFGDLDFSNGAPFQADDGIVDELRVTNAHLAAPTAEGVAVVDCFGRPWTTRILRQATRSAVQFDVDMRRERVEEGQEELDEAQEELDEALGWQLEMDEADRLDALRER